MQYKFSACGHPNVLATHKTTLEFTKDKELTLKGDCIVGVDSDFDLDKLKEFIKNAKSSKITMAIMPINDKRIKEIINAELTPGFNSNEEIVVRKTGFISERTFAINADKAACSLSRGLIGYLKNKGSKVSVIIENNC